MKKTIVLMAVFLLIGIAATTAHATPVKIYADTGLVSGLSVDLGGGTDYKKLHAGEFRIVVDPDGVHEFTTRAYCVDPFDTFRSGWKYDYDIIPVAEYDADFSHITGDMPYAAYYMDKYAVEFNGAAFGYSAKDTAGGLQLAIWKTLFPEISVNPDQAGDIWAVYMAIRADTPSVLTEDFFVAFNGDRQDQLFRKVPEPATMVLLGIGLLGLGVVNRRKMKK